MTKIIDGKTIAQNLRNKLTVIIVSHRKNTLKNCDKIIQIEVIKIISLKSDFNSCDKVVHLIKCPEPTF